jgi:hypothetical protein
MPRTCEQDFFTAMVRTEQVPQTAYKFDAQLVPLSDMFRHIEPIRRPNQNTAFLAVQIDFSDDGVTTVKDKPNLVCADFRRQRQFNFGAKGNAAGKEREALGDQVAALNFPNGGTDYKLRLASLPDAEVAKDVNSLNLKRWLVVAL